MRNVALQASGGPLAQLTEWLLNPTSPEGVAVYFLLVVALGIVGKLLWTRHTADDEPEVDFSDVLDEETLEEGHAEGQLLDDISESHKTVTAPAAIEWETRAARVGEQWTTTLYIADYADYPNDGYLSDLFELTDVEFDLTAHITPKNQQRARNELQDIADDLQVDADLEQSVRSAYLQERANEAAATYKAVESGANVFDQGMFVTVRADNKGRPQGLGSEGQERPSRRPGKPHAKDRYLSAGPRAAVGRSHRRQRVRPRIYLSRRSRWRTALVTP